MSLAPFFVKETMEGQKLKPTEKKLITIAQSWTKLLLLNVGGRWAIAVLENSTGKQRW